MGLPARPKCVVRIPTNVFVGEPATMNVELTMDRETKVNYIDVRVRGRQGWQTGDGQSTSGYTVDVPSFEKRVMPEGVLAEGVRTFPLSFTLPRGTAPSHTIAPAYSRLLIDVRVSIPWWLDGKYNFIAPVRLPPPEQAERTPLVSRHPFEAKAGEPRLELSLASSTLVAGEALVGSCALFHMADDSPRDVEVIFEPRVRMFGTRRPWETTGPGFRSTITLPAGSAGESVSFRIALPANMTPSFKTATHQIEWLMKLAVGSRLRGKVSMALPIVIVDARGAAILPALTLVPRVADQRVVAAFERFAASHGMSVVHEEQDRYPDEQPALVRDLGDATIRIGYAYRGEQGTFLVARVTYPPLGLGLSVTPSSTLRELLTRDIQIGNAVWDRAHHVEAREGAQAVPFLRATIPGVAVGALVQWNDNELVAERGIGGIEGTDLASIEVGLESLAGAIAAARALIVPPAGVTVDLADWKQLAERLNGQLVVGDLSIRGGTLDLQPIEVELVFDEDRRAIATRIEVGTSQPDAAEPNDRVRELLATVARDLPDAALSDGVASASIPLSAGGADAARVREVARALRAIVAALVESAGPYR